MVFNATFKPSDVGTHSKTVCRIQKKKKTHTQVHMTVKQREGGIPFLKCVSLEPDHNPFVLNFFGSNSGVVWHNLFAGMQHAGVL